MNEINIKRSNSQSILPPSFYCEFKIIDKDNRKKYYSNLNVYKNKMNNIKEKSNSKLIHKFEINEIEDNSENTQN